VTDIEKLIKLIRDTSENIETEDIRIDGLSPEFQELGQEICSILRQGQEINKFTASLSDGDLTVPVPPRNNYMAGPIKDLYYKLKHLEWQTNQVADGDYSQHVDFLGSFSDAFNRMIVQLKQREEKIRTQAAEQIRAVNRENQMMERQLEIQFANYQAYREYIESFLKFRNDYKEMMGEVYALFQQKKYEEARQLVAQINDRMGSSVSIRRDYSNHDYINAALTDISSFCKQKNITVNAMVHIPEGFYIDTESSLKLLNHTSELMYLLLSVFCGSSGSSLSIQSTRKSVWLSIVASYCIPDIVLPKLWPPEIVHCTKRIKVSAKRANAVFSLRRSKDGHTAVCILHLPDCSPADDIKVNEIP
jgi:hypothetical protein